MIDTLALIAPAAGLAVAFDPLALLVLAAGLGVALGTSLEPGDAAQAPDAPAGIVTEGRTPEVQMPTGRFTTAIEVRPILVATKPQWIAIREYEGSDLLYFTQILSWRCGLWELRYGMNGAPPEIEVPLEPCHEDTASPNALTDPGGAFPVYVTAPLDSIESVEIEITFDDGTTDAAVYARNSVLMP